MGALLVVRLVDEAAFFALPGAFESIRADLGLTYTQAAALLIAPYLGVVLGSAAGVLADTRSRRVLAVTGALVEAAALAVFASGAGFGALFVASVAIGFGATFLVDTLEVATVDLCEGDEVRLERFLARQNLLAVVGDLLGPALLVGAAAVGLGWRAVFAAVAVLLSAYGAWLATLPIPGPGPALDGDAADDGPGGWRAVVRDGRIWALVLLGILLDPLDEALLAFLVATLEVEGGWGPSAALVLGASTIAGGLVATVRAPARPSGGRLRPAAGATAVTTVALVLSGTGPIVVLTGAASGYAVTRLWLAYQVRLLTVRPGEVGAVQSVTSALDVTSMGLPLAIGALADGHGVVAGFACFAVVAVAAYVVAAGLDRSRP